MSSVYILFDPLPIRSSVADDVYGSCIKGIFKDRFHAINEQEKLKDSLDRPIFILKQKVIDPASFCKKKTMDQLLPANR